jgi:hypothetical protein
VRPKNLQRVTRGPGNPLRMTVARENPQENPAQAHRMLARRQTGGHQVLYLFAEFGCHTDLHSGGASALLSS